LNKLLIIGAFDFNQGPINGAKVKIREVADQLQFFPNISVSTIDTSINPIKVFQLLCSIWKGFRDADHIIIMPGYNGLRLLIHFYIYWKNKYKVKVHYIVLGGWLPDYVRRNTYTSNLLHNLDGIYVETNFIKKPLELLGFNNVHKMPNFRNISNLSVPESRKVDTAIKLVFISRVDKAKGICTAIRAVESVNSECKKTQFKLHIYGPIRDEFEIEFSNLLRKTGDDTKYLGVLSRGSEQVVEVMMNYDFLIFPTYYSGEGFAGVIIEAFSAGLPVIASDWRSNPELITHLETGLIFETESLESLTSTLKYIAENNSIIPQMRKKCIKEADKYSTTQVIKQFLRDINL
jgi:glycosyltransferase involved in cell wall biosynthesis